MPTAIIILTCNSDASWTQLKSLNLFIFLFWEREAGWINQIGYPSSCTYDDDGNVTLKRCRIIVLVDVDRSCLVGVLRILEKKTSN